MRLGETVRVQDVNAAGPVFVHVSFSGSFTVQITQFGTEANAKQRTQLVYVEHIGGLGPTICMLFLSSKQVLQEDAWHIIL